MPKLLKILFIVLLVSIKSYSQNLDGFKYVFVQTLTYQNGGIDNWGISSKIRSTFEKKGFVVLTETSELPAELIQDPCLAFVCYISHTNVEIGTNYVTITLKDCKNQILYANTGSAMGWSVQDDYNKATKRAISTIESIKYNFDPIKTPHIEIPVVEKTTETEESIRRYLSTNKIDPIEGIYKTYQGDQISNYKFGIIKIGNKFKAVILEDVGVWKASEVKAIIEPSSMRDLYSLKWYMGNKESIETFCNIENNGLLSVDFKNPQTGEKTSSKFLKMFPAGSSDVSINKEIIKSSGSGFFLTTNGVIATNAHVVEGANIISVTISNEIGTFTYKAKVLLLDSKNDVALLQINDEKFKGLTSIPYGFVENSEVGSKVFTIGYPLNDVMGSNYKVTDGIISSKSGIADDVRYYQISVPLQPGNSGGPLFNKDGNIIGITSARLNGEAVGTQIENVNYAIKSSYLLNLFNMLPNPSSLPKTSSVTAKELQEQVKIFKNYVCLIKIFN